MEFNDNLFLEYKYLLETTNIQECYQHMMKFINYLYLKLKNELNIYSFSSKVIENKMNFSYFQLTNQKLKELGLKIQVIFVHETCCFEVWLSGYNRKIQNEYYKIINTIDLPFQLCMNPNQDDYIVKLLINENLTVANIEKVIFEIKDQIKKIDVMVETLL